MMRMECENVRRHLTSARDTGLTGALGEHLGQCDACTRYAERIRGARRMFRDHHGNVLPDKGFAGRVAAALHQESTEVLGWAAARLLPATLALLVVLAWLSWRTAPDPGSLFVESPTEDLLSWVVERTEGGS